MPHTNGGDATTDDAQAVKWLRKAAELGDADAQLSLGVMYEKGQGVQQDDAEAFKWYKKAAAQGDGKAKEALRRLAGV